LNYKHFLILLGLLALGVPLRAADATTAPSGEGTVTSLTVTGARSVGADRVLALVRQRVGEPLNAAVVNEDTKRLWKMGLFQDVQVDARPAPSGQGLLLEYRVTERPIIQEVRYFGNKEVGDGTLKEKSALDAGQSFDQDKVAAAVRAIETLYKDKNYYAVQVSVDSKPGTEPGKVVVNFRIAEGNKMKIEEIRVDGNKVFSASRIKGEMKDTEEAGWISGGGYDPEKMFADYEAVLKMYAREGYVKAKLDGVGLENWGDKGKQVVRNSSTFDEANKRIVLTLKVEEGPKFRLGAVTISGTNVIPEAELRAKISSLKEPVLNQERWDADLAKLRAAYNEKGYIYANVTPDYKWDAAAGKVDVSLTVSEGGKAYIEDIRIRGNEVTKDNVIRRQLTLKAGDAFDMEAVNRNRMKIYNLGFFENVAYDVQPGSEMDKLILIYDVSPERKTGTLSLGAGYSSVEQLVGFLQVSQNNLFGNGQSVSVQWNFGTATTSYNLSFNEPWLLDRPLSLGVDLFNTTQNNTYAQQGFKLQNEGAGLRLGYALNEYWKAQAGYRYQTDIISDSTAQGIDNGIAHISSITPSLSRDTRDNIFDTTRGTFNVASVMLAGGVLGGDKSFYKPILDTRAFFQTPVIFGQDWMSAFVLGLHGRAGWAIPYSSGTGAALGADDSATAVPTSELFFMGGTDTVRGYMERRLGASLTGGGRFSLLGNIEYGFKPAPPVKLRVFYDTGNSYSDSAWLGKQDPYLYSSWGFGMLFTIPTSVIQIRLDVGFPLQPADNVTAFDTYKIHFNIGNIF
jgi:outer membrane protein insertion porin family